MKLRMIALAAALALPFAAAAQQPKDSPIGVYLSKTVIKNQGRNFFVKPGEVLLNELIVYENPEDPGPLHAFVSRFYENGDGCQVEGDVAIKSSSEFTVSEELFGSTCTITVKRSGEEMRVTDGSRSCPTFCGTGSPVGAVYKKRCGVVHPALRDKIDGGRLFAKEGADYGPDCPEKKD